jgi:hypothetical protein
VSQASIKPATATNTLQPQFLGAVVYPRPPSVLFQSEFVGTIVQIRKRIRSDQDRLHEWQKPQQCDRESPEVCPGCQVKMQQHSSSKGAQWNMILAGDIGGTNTRLALVEATADELRIVAEKTFSSRERTSLEAAVSEFLSLHSCDLTRASFGIAGPVRDGRCEATNLPWVVDIKTVANRLRLKRVGLINDLEANAYGIAVLQSKDFVILNKGARNARGNRAIISAGTGLGEAGMYWDGKSHRPFPSESPRNGAPRLLHETIPACELRAVGFGTRARECLSVSEGYGKG